MRHRKRTHIEEQMLLSVLCTAPPPKLYFRIVLQQFHLILGTMLGYQVCCMQFYCKRKSYVLDLLLQLVFVMPL